MWVRSMALTLHISGYLQVVSVGVIISSSEWRGRSRGRDGMEGKKKQRTKKEQINVGEKIQMSLIIQCGGGAW